MAGIDPAEYTVEEVKAWVLDNWHDHRNDAKVVGVHNAERDGKARVGLLDWLDHFAEDHDIDVTPRPGQQAAEPGVEVISLAPNSAAIGGPDVTMVVTGADATFNVRSEIIFNGGNEPTTLIDASHVSTTVRPSTATTPGSYDVWVWTDGTHDTAPAQFTFTPAVTPPPGPGPDELLTAQLRAWGISGEPVGWAPTSWQPVVYAIRAANLGFGTKATVDGLLDSIFPNNDLAASDICLSQLPSAVITPAFGSVPEAIVLSVPDIGLPRENTRWLVDNAEQYVGSTTPDLLFPPGEHFATVNVAVAGQVASNILVGDTPPDASPGVVRFKVKAHRS